MAKKAEVKVAVTVDGASTAAGEINKVEKAAGSAASGGLSSLTKGITGDLKNALSGTLPGATGDAATGLLGIAGPALGAGAAIAGLALKGVTDFENLGISIDNFSTATGTSMDTASRWTEVSKDLGVGSDAVESAFGKMNKTLANTPAVFDKYGVSVAHAKDGTVDANGTFLNAIETLQGIKNPTEQAAAGAAIFGKGWQGMAQLIATGAPQLRKDLASVQPEKIFTDKDVASAKGVRDGFDAIKDAGEGLMLTLGKALAPVIAQLAPIIGDAVTAIGPFVKIIGTDLANALAAAKPLLQGVGWAFDQAGKSAALWGHLLGDQKSSDQLIINYPKVKDAIDNTSAAFATQAFLAIHADDVLSGLGDTASGLSVESQHLADSSIRADDAIAAQNVTVAAAKRATDEATTAAKNYHDAMDAERQATQDLIDTERAAIDSKYAARKATKDATDAINAEQTATDAVTTAQTNLTTAVHKHGPESKAAQEATTALADAQGTLVDRTDAAFDAVINKSEADVKAKGAALDSKAGIDGQIQSLQAEADTLGPNDPLRARIAEYINDLNNIPTNVNTDWNLHLSSTGSATGAGARSGARASGGPVGAGQTYLVGEQGPEEVTFGANGYVTPTNQLGGGAMHVTINMPVGSDGNDVVSAIKKYERRNGPGWRQ